MRTIRFTQTVNVNHPGDHPILAILGGPALGMGSIELSTEVILDNDDDAEEEGRKASTLFNEFLEGLLDETEERENGDSDS